MYISRIYKLTIADPKKETPALTGWRLYGVRLLVETGNTFTKAGYTLTVDELHTFPGVFNDTTRSFEPLPDTVVTSERHYISTSNNAGEFDSDVHALHRRGERYGSSSNSMQAFNNVADDIVVNGNLEINFVFSGSGAAEDTLPLYVEIILYNNRPGMGGIRTPEGFACI